MFQISICVPLEVIALRLSNISLRLLIKSQGTLRLRVRRSTVPNRQPGSRQTAKAVSPPLLKVKQISANELRNFFQRCSCFQALLQGCLLTLYTVDSPLTRSIIDSNAMTTVKCLYVSPVSARAYRIFKMPSIMNRENPKVQR